MSSVVDDSLEEQLSEADEELQESENEGKSEDQQERVDQELSRIRERRENPGKSFLVNSIVPRKFDDYTLVFGPISGLSLIHI